MANFFGRNDDYMSATTKQDMFYASLIQHQQQTQQAMSQILDEIVKLNSRLEEIAQTLNELKQQAPAPAGGYAAQGSYQTPQQYDADPYQNQYGDAGYGGNAAYSQSAYDGPDIVLQPAAEEAAPAETFYANIEGDYLIECPEKYKQTAHVVVHAQGDEAIVEFNPLCGETYATSFDTNLIPYFDADVQNNNPTCVQPQNTATATKVGGYWKLKGRIKLKFY